jgi:hypothetical protein
VLRQHFDHASSIACRVLVPLEVALRVVQHRINLVAIQFVSRKQADGLGVLLKDLVEEAARSLHAALAAALLDGKVLPVDSLEADVRVICRLELAELLFVLAGQAVEDRAGGLSVFEELVDLVA